MYLRRHRRSDHWRNRPGVTRRARGGCNAAAEQRMQVNVCARLPRTPGVAAAGAALFLLIVGLSGACVPWSDPGLKGAVAVKLSDDNIVIRVKTCGEAPRLGSVELDSAR